MIGQTTQEETFFLQALQEEDLPEAPQKTVTVRPGTVSHYRRQLWQAWQQAVRRLQQTEGASERSDSRFPALSTTTSLDEPQCGHLTLPDSLEPTATLPFLWGRKDTASATMSPLSVDPRYPVFLYLHGSGPKALEWSTGWKLCSLFDDAPSYYFIPQIPQEGAYYRWWQRGKQWAAKRLWQALMVTPGIDPLRVYLFGISEGGYGSQRLAAYYADYLAAAGPMAGGEPLINAPAENLGHLSFSLLTGAEDRTFCRRQYTEITGQALDSLQRLSPGDYTHRVALIEGRGHSIDYRPTTPWMKAYVRQSHPRHFVWEDFEMDGCHRRGFYNLRICQRPSDTLRTRYEVDIDSAGIIDIQVSLVHYRPLENDSLYHFTLTWEKTYTPAHGGSFVLYLDERWVDLKRPVTVRVNGQSVYQGRIALSYQTMMESLATYSDPERIYPAAVTVRY